MHFISNNRTNLKDTSKAIFPSDFIYFYYFNDVYNYNYPYWFLKGYPNYILYISRVKAVRKNYTNDFVDYISEITLIV